MAAGDRIGWVTNAGEYIEYSPYGVELKSLRRACRGGHRGADA